MQQRGRALLKSKLTLNQLLRIEKGSELGDRDEAGGLAENGPTSSGVQLAVGGNG